LKIAIICDWLVTFAGAEKVLAEIIHCYPTADLFAVVDGLSAESRALLQNKPIKTTFIQKLPFAKKHYRIYLPLMPLAIEQLDVSNYDLVISTSHAVAKGVLTGPDQLHISYVYSPIRYAWDLQHQYLKESGLMYGLKSLFVRYILHKMRIWDQRTTNGVDHFIAISHFIARRIWKTYRREAQVIYPPIDLSYFTPSRDKQDYYVAASRLVPYKKIDLIVQAFATMPDKKLVVIGDGPDLAKVKSKATSNTQILGPQTNEQLRSHLQHAKAFIFAAEEDFGILPLEAQACGTPVIAYGKGGALETVRELDQEHPTGLFFEEQTVSSLCKAVTKFETLPSFLVEDCVNNARKFSKEIFREQFKTYVEQKLNEFKHSKFKTQ
jgi:glycosyltransferase involved in cell wall biosynthesis